MNTATTGPTPYVSVVLPAYNRAAMVGRSIESILAQTFTDFELLLVDDGSQDGTVEVLRRYTDPRIRVLALPHNGGEPVARNLGISAARGTYLAMMDSDDYAFPRRLEAQVAAMDADPELTACGTGIVRDFNGQRQDRNFMPASDGVIKARFLISDGAMFHPSVMYRRAIFDQPGIRYNSAQTTASDYEVYLTLMERLGARFTNVEEHLLEYLIHPESDVRRTPNHVAHKGWIARRAIGLFFPLLTGEEADVLAAVMAPGSRVPGKYLRPAVSAADKALQDEVSRYGEDRAELRQLVTGVLDQVSDSLAQSVARRVASVKAEQGAAQQGADAPA